MQLKKREKILAISAVLAFLLMGLYWLWPTNEGSLSTLQIKLEKKEEERDRNKNKALQARKANERLVAWQRRSLPSDPEAAQLLYQDWLRGLIKKADFRNYTISAKDGEKRKNIYSVYVFDIHGQGNLDKLTRFLYEFYSAGHLQKVRSLIIKPIENSKDLDLKITIEAMSLAGAAQKDKLSTELGKTLKIAKSEEYTKLIAGRNFFAAYTPPKPKEERIVKPPPSKPPEQKLDALQFSYLTAIIEADGIPEAWLFERTTGQTLRVHVGEEFNIEKIRGKVKRIGYNEIEIEIDGKTHTVSYGSNLKM